MARDVYSHRSDDDDRSGSLPRRLWTGSKNRLPGAESDNEIGPSPADEEVAEDELALRPARASTIDAASTFDGRFETAQDLRIEGTVSGEIACRGALYIEHGAVVRVKKVEAREVYIFGTFEGEIECGERALLAETAEVTGTIKAGSLVVLEGAAFNGSIETGDATQGRQRRSSRRRPAPDADALAEDAAPAAPSARTNAHDPTADEAS